MEWVVAAVSACPTKGNLKMMKTLLASALALGATVSLALAEPASTADPQPGPLELTDIQMDRITAGKVPPTNPSWGELTRAVAGRDLGQHASEEPTPRVGLANISFALLGGERGDLAATIDIILGETGGDLP